MSSEIDVNAPKKHPIICSVCRAESGRQCSLAKLEKNLGRRPTTFDTCQPAYGTPVDISKIPSECPNGYVEPDVQILRRPDIPLS